MKSQLRKTLLPLLVAFCLTVVGAPASAGTLYDNGPVNGQANAWDISSGNSVSNSFSVGGALGPGTTLDDLNLWIWVNWDSGHLVGFDWVISLDGGGIAARGTASNPTNQFGSTNQYGYVLDKVTASGLNVQLDPGTYWLSISNAVTESGDPAYWDENSGVGCGGSDGNGANCPSRASDSAVGTIPSEAFTINGSSGGSTPEPSSLALFGSGVLGICGLLRRRFLG